MLILKNIPQLLETKKWHLKRLPRKQICTQGINTDFDMTLSFNKKYPELKSHVSINEHSIETIDFSLKL
jgi:hypothetical protein